MKKEIKNVHDEPSWKSTTHKTKHYRIWASRMRGKNNKQKIYIEKTCGIQAFGRRGSAWQIISKRVVKTHNVITLNGFKWLWKGSTFHCEARAALVIGVASSHHDVSDGWAKN
jgi:hypothetical protein